jgi:beta-lactamase regulating signal transducer with metallopeptidase domain
MLAWMLYVIMVTLLLSVGAFVAERAARLKRGGTRWIWITAIVASLLLPTVIASVSVQLPSVMSPVVAQKMVVLRDATTQALSPVFWISGSAAQPTGWRDFDALLTTAWRAASVAMLLALVASGAHLMMRKRHWRKGTVAGVEVFVTGEVGPAVVGLLRPRIVVPRWVTMALPSHQSSVIAHEQSHLDARDPQLLTLALALLVFMPWNLPLWWQLRRLRYAIEIDCDARVLKGGVDPAHYGETLIVVGERQSAYIGAVAAMSESKSFLEERIEHMIRKPVRWRHLGAATLASFAIALTALAAQVSPPNAETTAQAQAPAPAAAAATPTERKAITLDNATLDRYVGSYKLVDSMLFQVKREGNQLKAQLTGQPFADIYPESETKFFWKIVDAQVEFTAGAGGATEKATIFQYGQVLPMPRMDSAVAEQMSADLAARIANQTPTPGGEAAIRRLNEGMASGKPNYDEMSSMVADGIKKGLPTAQPLLAGLGTLKTVTFRNVTGQGTDLYLATYEKGTMAWRIALGPDGKIVNAMVTPDF